ncbi:MAG: hypothetical protein D6761_03000 [Candidatus Dadabacteria bacterium]|nr:MAG: hypothetical protein D6761_03000 [Candidatus Dadabacteria bacterium]
MWTRRHLIQTSLATTACLTPTWSTVAHAGDLDALDPFAPASLYMERRSVFFDTPRTARAFASLWKAYQQTGRPEYAEWALIYSFAWWRSAPNRETRLKITKIADRAAEQYIQRSNPAPGGRVWQAIMLGAKVATLGLLEAAHMLPAMLDQLAEAEELGRPYYRGIIALSRAKIYYKAPAFPASVGNMQKARDILAQYEGEKSRIAAWWWLTAELEHIEGNTERAFELLREMPRKVVPPDVLLAYSLDTSVFDAAELIRAIRDGSYSRYLFDPFFLRTRPGLPNDWRPATA